MHLSTELASTGVPSIDQDQIAPLCTPPLQLDLLLKEDGCKEKVAAAKAQTNLLQRKLDFYVNDV